MSSITTAACQLLPLLPPTPASAAAAELAAWAVGSAAASYTLFHHLAAPQRLAAALPATPDRSLRAWTRHRCIALVALGALPWLPLAAVWPVDAGASLGAFIGSLFVPTTPLRDAAWAVGVALALGLPAALGARSPDVAEHVPRVRLSAWTREARRTNTVGWVAYLIGYELLFRGVLILLLARLVPVPLALSVGVGLYAFQHLMRSLGEGLGSVAAGVLYGLAALDTGTLWAPIVSHVAIAVAAERVAIRVHGGGPTSDEGAPTSDEGAHLRGRLND